LDCKEANHALIELRHDLAWNGIEHPGPFHANADPAPTRARVFDIIEELDVRVDALVIEKSKSAPKIRPTPERFYQYAWFYLMRYLVNEVTPGRTELLAVAASVGTRAKRTAFFTGVQDVMQQVARVTHRSACWDASSDGCLQIADYCTWAIQRKWELGDQAPYSRIKRKVRSEYEIFATGPVHYY
jgi:hypothetical protein